MAKKLRIVGYARVSTQRQAVEGFNLDGQIRQIKNYVEIYYENYELTILREDGHSAKTMDRPEITKIISMVKNREMDVLVIYTYDRLTRRLKDFIDFLDLMDQNGVTLDSMREKFDTSTASGRFMAHLITAMAEWEEDTISERTLRGLKEAALKGYFVRGGRTPFGYKKDPDDKHNLIIDEDEAETVKEIFESAANNVPLFSLSAVYDAERRNGSKNWTNKKIYNIIKDKIYYGVMTLNDVDYPVNVPPIISQELYEKANSTRRVNNYRSYEYIYKGFARCDKCGGILVGSGTFKESNKKYYHYYRCLTCKKTVSEAVITDHVEDIFTEKEREVQLDLFCQSARKANAAYAQALERLKVGELLDLPENYIEDKSKELRLKQTELTEKLKVVINSIRRIHFYKKTYQEQREFLSLYVSTIVIDFRTLIPSVKIVWKKDMEIKEDLKSKNARRGKTHNNR